MKLKKLLPFLLLVTMLISLMVTPASAEEPEEDYLWNLYDLNFNEVELDLNRHGFKFKVKYATEDGTLYIHNMTQTEEVADIFHTSPYEEPIPTVAVEIKFKTNSTNVYVCNLTNSNTMSAGYNLLINRDGILCLNTSSVPLTTSTVNNGEWHVLRVILENNETLTVILDGEQVYTGAASESTANAELTAGGFARYNLVIISTDVADAYFEADYIRIGDGEKGVVTTEAPTTEPQETDPPATTPAATEAPDVSDSENGSAGDEPAVTTGDSTGEDDAKKPDNTVLIIGIAAAVVVIAVVVILVIKKRK